MKIKLALSLLTILLCHNSLAGKEIISKPEPFYISQVPFFDATNNKRYFDEFEGQTLLLVFWATWCGTCIDEMHSLDTLAKDFRKLPFKVIALSQDYQGVKMVEQFYKSKEIRHLDVFHDYKNAVFQDMEVVGLPTAFLIDPNGKVKVILKGQIKWHEEAIRNIILDEIPGNPEIPKNTYKAPDLNQKTNNNKGKDSSNENKN